VNIVAALERLPGVEQAHVSFESGQASVTYDDTQQTPEKLAEAIAKLGYKAAVASVIDAPKSKDTGRR
jgi:copper chaperone CopZ